MQTSPAVEQIKTLNGPRVRGISPVGKETVYGGNDLPKSQVFSLEWKTERVREDASGDREDVKDDDDELPCVIGESEGDCVWRGSRRTYSIRGDCRADGRLFQTVGSYCSAAMLSSWVQLQSPMHFAQADNTKLAFCLKSRKSSAAEVYSGAQTIQVQNGISAPHLEKHDKNFQL